MSHQVSAKGLQRGFSLIEMMIGMVIAMVILGGLLLNFTSQSGMYKQRGAKADVVLDLEFVMRFIGNDVQAALISKSALSVGSAPAAHVLTVTEAAAVSGETYTAAVSFPVWDEAESSTTDGRVTRTYAFANQTLKYAKTGSSLTSILGDSYSAVKGVKVTGFRIFQDGLTPRSGYSGIPAALTPIFVTDENNKKYLMPAITVLLEVEVDAPPISGVVDVNGNTLVGLNKRRIWRYKQVYPRALID